MKLLLFLLALTPVTGPIREAANLIQQDGIKARMQFLAGDALEGRNAGTPGAKVAAEYIASEFMRLGLKPAGDSGTYFQNFETVRAWVDEANTNLKVKTDRTEKSFVLGPDFDIRWAAQSNRSAEVSAPLMFAGYGISAPEYGYNDLAGADVRGKIVIVLSREPQASDAASKFKGKWDTLYSYPWFKTDELQKAGAAGILLVMPDKERRPKRLESGPPDYEQRGGPRYSESLTTGLWNLPVFTITTRVANELLAPAGKTVEALQGSIDQNYRPQSFDLPNEIVTMKKTFNKTEILNARNVAGILEGSDAKLKNEALAITAHYDHGGVLGNRTYPGADDNASGTIAVIEIARAYVRGNIRPKRSILFIVFDAEERGLLGSFYYIDHPLFPVAQTVTNLNMDMIGRDEESPTWNTTAAQNTNGVNIVGTLYDPELRAAIEAQNEYVGLKLDYKTDTDDREGWFARSDHFAFAMKSIPMVLFNTGEQADYHTENDTWQRINYPKMTKIVRLVFLTSAEVADSKERIKFSP